MIVFTFIGYLCCLMCAWNLGYYGAFFLDLQRKLAPIERADKELNAILLRWTAALNTKEPFHG